MAITTKAGLSAAITAATGVRDISVAPGAGYRSLALQSTWRDFGGAIPTTMAVCDNTTTGALVIPTSGGGTSLHLAGMQLAGSSYSGQAVYPYDNFRLFDRIAACGGLYGNTTSPQTVDTAAILTRGVLANYSNVVWMLEWYGTSGGTAVTWTWTYTDHEDNAGLTFTTTNSTSTANNGIQLLPHPGTRYIKAITGLQLSATSGATAQCGVTAAVLLGGTTQRDSFKSASDWQQLGLMPVNSAACLMLVHQGQYNGGGFSGHVTIAKG